MPLSKLKFLYAIPFQGQLILLLFFITPHCFASASNDVYLGQFSFDSAAGKLPCEMVLDVSGREYHLPAEDAKKWFSEKEQLTYSPGYLSEIENRDFCAYKKSLSCKMLFSVKKSENIRKKSEIFLDTDSVMAFLEDLSRRTDRDPVDAKLSAENGKVSSFALSQNGLRLDKEKSFEILRNYFVGKNGGEIPIKLEFYETKPSVSSDDIENLGIKSLIGEGRSNFKGSPKNRIFNIKVATNRFNGVLIRPGEEFSFVKILGEVDGEHGYLPEMVIKKDKTEPEFGGGICQVSTTTFRAAINSGLKITARKNHAYPVKYYNPQGMDATVYVPHPDLRFINNTSGHILIQAKIEGTELVFQFYGTTDERKIEIDGPRITQRNPDGSMKAVFSQKVYFPDGEILVDDVFYSSYDSPSKYPHTGEIFTAKPDGWTSKQWKAYKKTHNL